MKKLILAILVIATVVLVGTWPLSILGKVLEWLGSAMKRLAGVLDFFGWNGLL